MPATRERIRSSTYCTIMASMNGIAPNTKAMKPTARIQNAQPSLKAASVGNALPVDGSTLDFRKVIGEGRFKSKEPWLDKNNRQFVPEEYFNLGGKTKWYGAALLRFDRSEFQPEPDFKCLGWPLSYDEMEPYYEEVEKLLDVHCFAIEPNLKLLLDKIDSHPNGWRSSPLPLALDPAIVSNDYEARHFDGFASVQGLKADGERSLLHRIVNADNFTLMTGHAVKGLIGDNADPYRIAGVMLVNGQCFTANGVMLAAGALHSPRLLQDYLDSSGLAESLPCAGLVGSYFKRHILTAMLAFSRSRKTDPLRKTTVWLNDQFPHSSIQPLGFSEDVLTALLPSIIPRWLARRLGARAYGFFLQTEDGSDSKNCVSTDVGSAGIHLPKLNYDPGRFSELALEHKRMIQSFRRTIRRAGCLSVINPIPLAGTAHACGTLVAGNDPQASVVDRNGKVHGFSNLYVVDGSILPRSSRVNPALTIYAWALRTADYLIDGSNT